MRGKRVYSEVFGTHFGRTSVVAALNKNNEAVAPFVFKGHMDGDLFEGWLEQIFAPCIKTSKKTVFFIDNARHHRKNAIYDIADEYGFTVIFIPKYSPDLNPIEKYWAIIKN